MSVKTAEADSRHRGVRAGALVDDTGLTAGAVRRALRAGPTVWSRELKWAPTTILVSLH